VNKEFGKVVLTFWGSIIKEYPETSSNTEEKFIRILDFIQTKKEFVSLGVK